jgi:hypothetical protein
LAVAADRTHHSSSEQALADIEVAAEAVAACTAAEAADSRSHCIADTDSSSATQVINDNE